MRSYFEKIRSKSGEECDEEKMEEGALEEGLSPKESLSNARCVEYLGRRAVVLRLVKGTRQGRRLDNSPWCDNGCRWPLDNTLRGGR